MPIAKFAVIYCAVIGPMSGKTHLMAAIIDQLERRFAEAEEAATGLGDALCEYKMRAPAESEDFVLLKQPQ